MQDGDIRPSFFKNGIEGVGIFQYSTAVVLVLGVVGGKILSKK